MRTAMQNNIHRKSEASPINLNGYLKKFLIQADELCPQTALSRSFPLLSVDSDSIILKVNDGGCKTLGLTRENLEGKNIEEILNTQNMVQFNSFKIKTSKDEIAIGELEIKDFNEELQKVVIVCLQSIQEDEMISSIINVRKTSS